MRRCNPRPDFNHYVLLRLSHCPVTRLPSGTGIASELARNRRSDKVSQHFPLVDRRRMQEKIDLQQLPNCYARNHWVC